MIPKAEKQAVFKPFEPLEHAALALNYLTQMTDSALDCLPYGLTAPFCNPPFAEHNRIDDAELVASWLEGISCCREMLGTNKGADVEESLANLLLKQGWDAASGLRFPVRRPWSPELEYCVIPEMAAVLSALNRICETNPGDKRADKRAAALVAGLRAVVVETKQRVAGPGVFNLEETCCMFPGDVFVRGKGFVQGVATGFTDWAIRCCMLIAPLVQRHAISGDKGALALATGLANSLTSLSHPFTYRNEFAGHVHSALATAVGLAYLGRVTGQDRYVAKAKGIYDFVRRSTSAFGWCPEYMQWQLMADERCPANAVSAMMQCALQLVDCGFPEYWDDVHRFWRNHLAQSQLMDTGFLPKSAKAVDTAQRTYKNIAERLCGGFSGGTAPNSLALGRPNAISGQSSAVAPVGMLAAWRRSIEFSRGNLLVNFPVNCENDYAKVVVGYPNTGCVRIKLKKSVRVIVRVFPWMPSPHEGTVDGRPAGLERRDDQVSFPVCESGSVLELRHDMKLRRVMENVMGLDFFGMWRGPDMVDILPHGLGLRLYQRVEGASLETPSLPPENLVKEPIVPVLEPINVKETRLNRRKAPRN